MTHEGSHRPPPVRRPNSPPRMDVLMALVTHDSQTVERGVCEHRGVLLARSGHRGFPNAQTVHALIETDSPDPGHPGQLLDFTGVPHKGRREVLDRKPGTLPHQLLGTSDRDPEQPVPQQLSRQSARAPRLVPRARATVKVDIEYAKTAPRGPQMNVNKTFTPALHELSQDTGP